MKALIQHVKLLSKPFYLGILNFGKKYLRSSDRPNWLNMRCSKCG
jgi:hypothetical protein